MTTTIQARLTEALANAVGHEATEDTEDCAPDFCPVCEADWPCAVGPEAALARALLAVLGVLDNARPQICLDCAHPDCMLELDVRKAITAEFPEEES